MARSDCLQSRYPVISDEQTRRVLPRDAPAPQERTVYRVTLVIDRRSARVHKRWTHHGTTLKMSAESGKRGPEEVVENKAPDKKTRMEHLDTGVQYHGRPVVAAFDELPVLGGHAHEIAPSLYLGSMDAATSAALLAEHGV